MIPTNREPSDAELAAMSDEELDALLASTQQAPTEQAPSTFETVAQEADNMAIAASQSLRQGATDAFTGVALLARDLSDADAICGPRHAALPPTKFRYYKKNRIGWRQ